MAKIEDRSETLTATATNILAGVVGEDAEGETPDHEILTKIVLQAEYILTQKVYHLRGERDLSPDARRRMMNAVAAQWGGR